MYPYLLHHLLENAAEIFPAQNALIFKDSSITYKELNRRSNQLSSALIELGVEKGDRVGFLLNKSIEAVACIFGILKTGAIYVPIDPLAPSERIKYIVGNCDVQVLICSSQNLSKIITSCETGSCLKKLIVTDVVELPRKEDANNLDIFSWEQMLPVQPDKNIRLNFSDTNPAYILHTSGSTGRPKGVVLSHLNAMSFVNIAADFFKPDSSDRFSSQAPFHFDLSVFDIYVAMKCGASIVLIPEFLALFPLKLGEYIEEKQISVWNSVSSVLILLANFESLHRFNFDSLRHVIFSGEFLPAKYLRKIQKHMANASLYNLYGQTEANSSMYYKVETIPDDDAWKVPIGKPFNNFEVFAINDHGEIIRSVDEAGMLYVKSSTVAIEYWRNKEKSNEVFVSDPRNSLPGSRVYNTGDIVKIDADNNYVLVGRIDRVVKSRGYRIELDEIEGTLKSHPLVNSAAVINIPNELIGNNIIAFVTPVSGEALEAVHLSEYCNRLLPKYMIPDPIEIRMSLPATPNGKIDREMLKNEVLSRLQ